MSTLNIVLLISVVYAAVFLEGWLRHWNFFIGSSLDLVPGLIVYSALSTNLPTSVAISVLAGLWLDSLSANPLGISIVPLALVAVVIQYKRDLILREQTFARFFLGAVASSSFLLLSSLLLLATGNQPLIGWGTVGQMSLSFISGGLVTLGYFRLFDRFNRALSYAPLPESSFRTDREIKRGRA